jgi:ribonuclease PH
MPWLAVGRVGGFNEAMNSTRRAHQLRPTTIEPCATAAAGGVIITQGNTRVMCTASIETQLPPWLKDADPPRGWVTAEYAMLPGSTPDRKRRGSDGRSTEIQRLIGRSLRASVDLLKMPGVLISCDCDVLVADGGTRTAAITGAWVALAQAIGQARRRGAIQKNPLLGPVAAVSVGVVDGQTLLDLDYKLDVNAQVDMNVAMNHRGQFIEVQGTAEGRPFSQAQLDEMLALASRGIGRLMRLQLAALRMTTG